MKTSQKCDKCQISWKSEPARPDTKEVRGHTPKCPLCHGLPGTPRVFPKA